MRPLHELHVHGPRPAQHHHERPDPAHQAVVHPVPVPAEVHMGLLPFEAHRRLGKPPLPQGMNELFQDRVAAVVPHGPDLPQQHDAVVHPFCQPPEDIILVGVELGAALGQRLRLGDLRCPDLPHRVSGDLQPPGDLPDRLDLCGSFYLVKEELCWGRHASSS